MIENTDHPQEISEIPEWIVTTFLIIIVFPIVMEYLLISTVFNVFAYLFGRRR